MREFRIQYSPVPLSETTVFDRARGFFGFGAFLVPLIAGRTASFVVGAVTVFGFFVAGFDAAFLDLDAFLRFSFNSSSCGSPSLSSKLVSSSET